MTNIEIDGKQVSVPPGGTVMDGARQLGIYIPYFCYHKKLSIAANCRMCLVQVEKAPKPMPACSTPAVEGMKVSTHSAMAILITQDATNNRSAMKPSKGFPVIRKIGSMMKEIVAGPMPMA